MKNLFILGMVLFNVNAFGNEKGNGGFLYSRTSLKLLEDSQKSILDDLNGLMKKRENLFYSSGDCQKEINFSELNTIVKNLTYDFNAVSSAINPDGKDEKRYFHINAQNKVEATELYFSSFVDTYFRYMEAGDLLSKENISRPVRVAILHEALHLFNYGEQESRSCSRTLLSVVESYNDEKRESLKKEINETNDLRVEKYIEEKCKISKEVDVYRYLDSEFRDLSSYHLYNCIVQWGLKEQNLQWESSTYSTRKALNQIKGSMGSTKILAKTVNEIFSFAFEIPLPRKE